MVAFARFLGRSDGQVFVFFITVAAAEVAVARPDRGPVSAR